MDEKIIMDEFNKLYAGDSYKLNLKKKHELKRLADIKKINSETVEGYEVRGKDDVFIGLYDCEKKEIAYTIKPN